MITYNSPTLMIYQEPDNWTAPKGTLYVYFGNETLSLFPNGDTHVAPFNDRASIVDLSGTVDCEGCDGGCWMCADC